MRRTRRYKRKSRAKKTRGGGMFGIRDEYVIPLNQNISRIPAIERNVVMPGDFRGGFFKEIKRINSQ